MEKSHKLHHLHLNLIDHPEPEVCLVKMAQLSPEEEGSTPNNDQDKQQLKNGLKFGEPLSETEAIARSLEHDYLIQYYKDNTLLLNSTLSKLNKLEEESDKNHDEIHNTLNDYFDAHLEMTDETEKHMKKINEMRQINELHNVTEEAIEHKQMQEEGLAPQKNAMNDAMQTTLHQKYPATTKALAQMTKPTTLEQIIAEECQKIKATIIVHQTTKPKKKKKHGKRRNNRKKRNHK